MEGDSATRAATKKKVVRGSVTAESRDPEVATVSKPKGDNAQVTITGVKEGKTVVTIRGKLVVYKMGIDNKEIMTEEPFEEQVDVVVKKEEKYVRLAVIKRRQYLTIDLPKNLKMVQRTFKNHNKKVVRAKANTTQKLTVFGKQKGEAIITVDLIETKKGQQPTKVRGIIKVEVQDERAKQKERRVKIGWDDLYTGRIVILFHGEEPVKKVEKEEEKDKTIGLVIPESQDGYAISYTGYGVASDSPKKCTHGDATETPVASGPESGPGFTVVPVGLADRIQDEDDGGSGLPLSPVVIDDEDDDPRDTPKKDETPAFYTQVKLKEAKTGTGSVVGNRRMKLIDPELSKPALAMDDEGKDDYGSDLDPLSCTARKGECTVANVPVEANGGKAPKAVTLNVPSEEVKSYNVRAVGGALAEARRRFGSLVGADLALAGATYLTLFTDPAGVAAIQKSANAQPGIEVRENKCRKEKPGPPVESLATYPALPADPLPGRKLKLRP